MLEIILVSLILLIIIIIYQTRFPKIEELKRYIQILSGSMVDGIEISSWFGLKKIKLKSKQTKDLHAIAHAHSSFATTVPEPSKLDSSVDDDQTFDDAQDSKIVEIKSPLVGTFYLSLNTDEDPLVIVGQDIKKEQVVCIITSMNIPSEIKSEVSGTIAKILVENGNPVQFGDTLMLVELK